MYATTEEKKQKTAVSLEGNKCYINVLLVSADTKQPQAVPSPSPATQVELHPLHYKLPAQWELEKENVLVFFCNT